MIILHFDLQPQFKYILHIVVDTFCNLNCSSFVVHVYEYSFIYHST